MRVLNIGKLNKRLTFLKLVDSVDELGQKTKRLKEIKEVWGSLYPVRGAEFYEIQKIQSKTTHKCYVRFFDGVDTNCFIRYQNHIYSVESVLDVDLEHKMLEIQCAEYTNGGDFYGYSLD